MLKTIFVFSAISLSVFALFQLSKWSLLTQNAWAEYTIAVVALVGFGVGIWWSRKERRQAKIAPPKTVDYHQVQAYQISPREYEVLQQMALGSSNKEIAKTLFLSESTIKSHVSSILQKLDCRNRKEATQKAFDLNLLIDNHLA